MAGCERAVSFERNYKGKTILSYLVTDSQRILRALRRLHVRVFTSVRASAGDAGRPPAFSTYYKNGSGERRHIGAEGNDGASHKRIKVGPRSPECLEHSVLLYMPMSTRRARRHRARGTPKPALVQESSGASAQLTAPRGGAACTLRAATLVRECVLQSVNDAMWSTSGCRHSTRGGAARTTASHLQNQMRK